MKKRRIIKRIVVFSLVFVLLAAGVICGGVYYLLTTEKGGKLLVEKALPYTEEYAGQKVVLEGFNGVLTDKISAKKLIVSDAKGKWLEVENFTFDWKFKPLLKKNLWVENLSAEKIDIVRKPVFPETDTPEKPVKKQGRLDLSPLTMVRVDNISLEQINISENITNSEPLSYSLAAAWDLSGDKKTFIELTESGAEQSLIRLDTKGEIDKENISFDLIIKALPTETLQMADINIVPGEMNAKAHLEGNPEYPDLTADIDITANLEGEANEEKFSYPVALQINAKTAENLLNLDIKTLINRLETGNLTAQIPLTVIYPDYPDKTAVNGRITADIALSTLQQLLPDDQNRIAGNLKADINFDDKFAENPDIASVNGKITMDNGTFHNTQAGASIDDIKMLVELAGARAVIKEISATDGAEGRINITGWAEKTEDGYTTEIDLTARELWPIKRDDVEGDISADIKLAGNQNKIDITGNITTGKIDVTLPKDLASDIPAIEVADISKMEDINPATGKPAKQVKTSNINLDLNINAPGKIFVHGNGLEMELSGDLGIKGDAMQPAPKGEFKTVRGRLELFNRKFDVSEGRVRIDGEEIYLQITTETDIDDDRIIVSIVGPASKPEIKLRAIPDLPEDEIMARILFGKHVKDTTPIQALQLANAVRKLKDGFGGGGFDPIAMTRTTLGVDSLTVESDDSGDDQGVKVGAGKYVSENVYVEVNKSTASEGVNARVELELTPNISVESSTSSATQSVGVGLNWKYDY